MKNRRLISANIESAPINFGEWNKSGQREHILNSGVAIHTNHRRHLTNGHLSTSPNTSFPFTKLNQCSSLSSILLSSSPSPSPSIPAAGSTRTVSRHSTMFFKVFTLFLLLNSHFIAAIYGQRTVPASNKTYTYFEDVHNEKFTHMTVNEYTGQVYIGAVNKIYQLSNHLVLEAVVEMGPYDDSPECPVTRICAQVTKRKTDYWNKALVIDYPQSRLISCGSLFQGICSVHKLDNVTSYETPANESVVANNATASTVAFIAQGPPKLARMHVLYVGVSYTGNGPYRSDVPAVSSRSLDPNNMFSIAATGVTTGTRLLINSLSRDRYPITYIYGFASKGFSYFVTVQKKFTEMPKPFLSKLIRICQQDVNYYSYTEVPLVCQYPDTIDYNLAQAAFVGRPGSELAVSLGITAQDEVLFVVFSKSKDEADVYNKPSTNSALCVYALSAIHRKFTQNIQHCFNGVGNQGLDFVNPSQACVPTQVQINENFCGMDVNTPLGGSMPIEAAPVLTYSNVLLTSVAATSTHDYTVAFLGTSNGHLKKAVVESVTSAFEYNDIVIDDRKAVNADMFFDPNNKNYLYVMTEKRVTMVKVQECHVYRTCTECLGAKDPYCGWCSLENKCSLRSDCAEAAQDPLYWLSYKSGKCTTITHVHPPQIQWTTARTLNLIIDNLPVLEGQFFCVFTAAGRTQMTNATRSANGVTCPTPPTDKLAPIPSGRHHFTAKLSVRMKVGPDFVATNFTFYDCSSYTSCTKCVSSPFPCDWCVGGHRCTHDTGENCRNDILVTGVSSVGPSIRSGPGFCPRINSTSDTTTEILVPSGSLQPVQVKVDNIPQFIVTTRFVCHFNIGGRVATANGRLLGEIILCDPVLFQYTADVPNITATFAVIWDISKPLDNPENIHVLIYRCDIMARNCGFCLELPEKYNCGWCHDHCDVQEKCAKNWPQASWLNQQEVCPDPKITDFYPKSGPWEGGTNITIEGINLGRNFEDIANGVHIAHEQNGITVGLINCIPFRELYEKTSKITCQVLNPNITTHKAVGPVSGPVIVKIQNDYTAKSIEHYRFVNPHITSIAPGKGPTSGGTRLSIWGLHMDAGSKIVAKLGNLTCEVISRDTNRVECITSKRHMHGEEKVSVTFDNGVRVFEHYRYLYVEDPKVTTVESGSTGPRGVPKGIPSGGIIVSVKGYHFNSIQSPMMYVEVDGVKYNSSCTVESAVEMKCKSPKVPLEKLSFERDKDDAIELDFGFIMDNVKSVMDLSKREHNPFPKFLMYQNPEYFEFTEANGIKYYKSDYLTINGVNLDRASQEADVTVKIGNGLCNVTSLSRSQLTCRPPTTQPAAITSDGKLDYNRIPDVVVVIGDSLNFTIGKLSYELPPPPQPNLPKPILIAAIVGSCLLIVIVIIILIAYRRKSTESSRVLKTMQEQMDVLELRVASECKEAFAELQTEMTDLTGEMTAGGIPFHDYKIHAVKVLFSNKDDYSVLMDIPMEPTKQQGLLAFGQLIMNKTFLLLFVRTLESNRFFSMKERVNVAALIMVTLQGKMEYCTDILKTLLADLIEKCMEGKSHPKLLLRRNESVAEKMLSSWFAFLLHKFLKECAGEPLYLLYRAIKQQVDKGPVDAITGEARYSLSEEKLIRQSIEYKALTVYVSMSPQTAYVSGLEPIVQCENTETPVKVLDCDTISQVKEKALDTIYRNIPYSQRPSKDDLDLEWRTGQSGRIILSDEDTTSRVENEWKRLNTLAHYKVQDGASLTLVPKQSSVYNISIISEKMEKSHKYETLNFGFNKAASPPLSRATSPLNHDLETGYKYWHLVKHHDGEHNKEGDRGNKMVSEIYLTRLLATKGTLQKFVDDLFETIFSIAHRGSALPLAIKYMFDFLDDQALQHGITDPETVHTWKSNSLPLRFWVNLIKNPNFVFDIHKSNIVDSCLSVVAQTFMDACSKSDHRLGKDSPSSKLLYAKDIPIYKDWVERYYRDIQTMSAISDQDMNAMLAEESRQHAYEFNTLVALNELYTYAAKYHEELMRALEEDEFSQKNNLAFKFDQVTAAMSGQVDA
ncbi:plexin A-like protein [Dinothrombium tinctorium]|uniref:Plexin A-like protein n=1 Tax=Dinothrombium tinctorium TaxID=1965070 RepID=A0A3S3SN47_9ACAR|nr:plexin A-like protein [Dinothrombium tinctorium]RWS17588.1 plexin A-like protein [Dinothrombium tinctorium]RWS17739.1 plexin A-like protein [Dinothrombium tinctorium]